ncbi:unnamed protein product [Ectocarpus sp. CCAP 1310/34]|nr:unnamed protein product [Ectocarpus sp. CCAP 1310/34]
MGRIAHIVSLLPAEREDPTAENPAARTSSWTQGDKPGKPDGATTEPVSGSSREADMDHMTQAQMSSMDRAALIALYRSTDGANWKRKRNWNTEAGLATWQGVRLNHAGRVVELALPNNNLHGIAMSSPRCEFAYCAICLVSASSCHWMIVPVLIEAN